MLLERQIREDILERISDTIGYRVTEDNLSPAIKQSITNIIKIRKNLLVLEEIYRGEIGRIENSVVLKITNRVRKNRGLEEEYNRILAMKNDLDKKIISIAERELMETTIRQAHPEAEDKDKNLLKVMELKCPKCGAPMPFPNSYTIRCKYCGTEFLVSDIFPQMDLLIRTI